MGVKKKILDALDRFLLILREKTLQTLEEIEANTSGGYWAGADAVDALNNKLDGCAFEVKEDGAYIKYTLPGGADPVLKKLGSMELAETYNTTSPVVASTNKISVNKNIVLQANGEYILFCVLVAAGTAASRGNLLFDRTTVKVANGTAEIEKLSPGWFIWKIRTSTECTINISGTITGSDGGSGATFGLCSIAVFG